MIDAKISLYESAEASLKAFKMGLNTFQLENNNFFDISCEATLQIVYDVCFLTDLNVKLIFLLWNHKTNEKVKRIAISDETDKRLKKMDRTLQETLPTSILKRLQPKKYDL